MGFKEDGFFVLPEVLTHAECDAAAADIDAFYASGKGSRVVNLHSDSKAVLHAITKQSVFDWVSENCFRAPAIYTTLSFRVGTQQPIHRDVPHFHTEPKYQFIGVWYALEDTDINNGCLQYYKGGHLVDDIDGPDLARRVFPALNSLNDGEIDVCMNHYQDAIDLRCQSLEVHRGVMKKGSALVWDARLPHGGGLILKEGSTRKSVVAHCVPMGTRVYNAREFFRPIPKRLPEYPLSYISLPTGWVVQEQQQAAFQQKYV